MAAPEILARYYQEFFPCQEISEWLSCGQRPDTKDPYSDGDYFSKREFSFTLAGDIYCRYLSFANAQEMREALVRQLPEKVDAGAVFTFSPRAKSSGMTRRYEPVERELVFDIDMTDYDNVRTCCMGAKLCSNCWQYMVVAAQALKIALEQSFGFSKILWVFSGRRGIHCWVSDEKARRLTNMQRSQLVTFLTGGPQLHSPFEQIYEEVFQPAFEDVVVQRQAVFEHPESVATIMKTLKNEDCKVLLDQALREGGASIDVWSRFKASVRAKGLDPLGQKAIFMDLSFALMFPRLDVHVSTAMNHLLKLPFSIHPATGKVCVPFNPDNLDSFDVNEVPLVTELLDGEKSLESSVGLLRELIAKVVREKQAERSAQISITRSLESPMP
jgi:DNA primase small subunit